MDYLLSMYVLLQEQQAQWSSIVARTLDSSIKLVELNLKMARQSVEESTQSVQHMLQVKSPNALFAVDQELTQERLNQAMNYAGQISAIASEFIAAMSQATQAQMSGNLGRLNSFSAAPETPAPIKNLFADSAMVQQGYEQWVEAGKKFVAEFGQNFPAAFNGAGVAKAAEVKPSTTTRSRARAK